MTTPLSGTNCHQYRKTRQLEVSSSLSEHSLASCHPSRTSRRGTPLDLSQASTTSLTLGQMANHQRQMAFVRLVLSPPTPCSTVSPGASVGTLTVKGNIFLSAHQYDGSGSNKPETTDLLRATNTQLPAPSSYARHIARP